VAGLGEVIQYLEYSMKIPTTRSIFSLPSPWVTGYQTVADITIGPEGLVANSGACAFRLNGILPVFRDPRMEPHRRQDSGKRAGSTPG
jgi:hypothetical protein